MGVGWAEPGFRASPGEAMLPAALVFGVQGVVELVGEPPPVIPEGGVVLRSMM